MNGDLSRVTDDLIVLVDVGRAEVDEDVYDEHDVYDEVNDGQRVPVAGVGPVLATSDLGAVLGVVEKEGGNVGRADGRVDDEQEDEPIPDSLERRVVKDGEAVDGRGV